MATQQTKDGLGYIIQAISNIVEPKMETLKYDKTYRAKIVEEIEVGIYKVQINNVIYKLSYDGALNVGDIVRVKAPLNNFSDIYIEPLPGSGGDITNQLLEKIYPVGSIYISANRVSPQQFLGGVWEPFAYGRTLVGVDDSESSPDMDFAEPLKTGGEKAHQLTIKEMPSHRHLIHGRIDRNQGSGTIFREIYNYNETGGTENNVESFATGGNKAHNNMQPYITVYMWRRIS